ncbi:hypothetical protein SSX86_011891 [Deinandra increscens subsp. villosa]|uniref:DUF7356 domain-containing protein n=1 Tax=Deinandra increscens subsp. villosa TaxID=3103831 RepID=A0AAP0D364_9ASTR
MDKNGSLIVFLLLFIIFFYQSNAFNSRRLVTTPDPNQDPLSSSPPPFDKTLNLSHVEAPKPKDTQIANPSVLVSKGLNDASAKNGSESSSDKKLDKGEGSKRFASEYCKGNPICSDQGKSMMACVQEFENGSGNLTLIVQNEQDVDLKVKITLGTSMNSYMPTLSPHATEKVNITFSGDKSNKVILNAGNGDCELQISQPKTIPINSTESKDPENTSNLEDATNPADSPAKPKDVINPAGSPAKPKDVIYPAGSPTKPKDIDKPAKSKDVNTPAKSKDVDNPAKSKEADDPKRSKSKSKSEDIDNPSKPTTISANTRVSKNNFFDQLTFYSKQATPMHGAYLAFLIALVIGGSWALCSFRKRKTDGGVPYQELEMGPSDSSNAVVVETAEGWDQDWDDDDWDEDKAIRSPGGSLRAQTISSNGLTSRATKKDSWDADWDD